jgi:hypothetical protein
VRIIYTDEAGISTPEKVSVVAALIVNPDAHWFPIMRRIREVWDQHIPTEYRHGNRHKFHGDFTFHAKEVVDQSRYPNWDEDSRRALMESMMAIPREFEIPVSLSAVKRGAFDWSGWPTENKKSMTPAKSDHMMAFAGCIAEANEFIKSEMPNELALIIADDNGEMREILRTALNRLQGQPLAVDVAAAKGEGRDLGAKTKLLGADRIIDEVCFLQMRNAPFLQIVDACAFGFRRWLAAQSHGDEYLRAISGASAPAFPDDWRQFFSTIDHKSVIELARPNRVIVVGGRKPEVL